MPCRLHVITNELPRLGDASTAIVGRFVLLPLSRSWLGKENHRLEQELLCRASGILNWALDGLERLTFNDTFTRVAAADEAIIAMRDLASPVGAFVRERCKLGASDSIEVGALYAAFKTWCTDNEHPKSLEASLRSRPAGRDAVAPHRAARSSWCSFQGLCRDRIAGRRRPRRWTADMIHCVRFHRFVACTACTVAQGPSFVHAMPAFVHAMQTVYRVHRACTCTQYPSRFRHRARDARYILQKRTVRTVDQNTPLVRTGEEISPCGSLSSETRPEGGSLGQPYTNNRMRKTVPTSSRATMRNCAFDIVPPTNTANPSTTASR